jgi:hypothetical protein
VVCVPAAITYRYVADPAADLGRLAGAIEARLLLQPRPDLPLVARVGRLREAFLALKEVEQRGRAQPGGDGARIAALTADILGRLEARYGAGPRVRDLPGRVAHLRRLAVRAQESAPPGDPRDCQARRDLDDLLAAVQLFSYAEDDLAGTPPVEHVAEILDRLEEDVLKATIATPRAMRRGFIRLGEPLPVRPFRADSDPCGALTAALERRVAGLLAEAIAFAEKGPGGALPAAGAVDADRHDSARGEPMGSPEDRARPPRDRLGV